MDLSSESRRPDFFTQGCRDILRTFTYEDIVACTMFGPPILFMIGPAALAANCTIVPTVLFAVLGFGLSLALHRLGRRLFSALPKEPQPLCISRSIRLPLRLTLSQFLSLMGAMVAVAVFCAILGTRWMAAADVPGIASVALFGAAALLYFLPVYLGRLWMTRYYPAMTLLGPSPHVINAALPGIWDHSKIGRMDQSS
ncbi:MAG TPA: hypothetical protein VFS39_00920 [Nitrospira sp.]|nr:hypothetical protein [Nitrospira sp.]